MRPRESRVTALRQIGPSGTRSCPRDWPSLGFSASAAAAAYMLCMFARSLLEFGEDRALPSLGDCVAYKKVIICRVSVRARGNGTADG